MYLYTLLSFYNSDKVYYTWRGSHAANIYLPETYSSNRITRVYNCIGAYSFESFVNAFRIKEVQIPFKTI